MTTSGMFSNDSYPPNYGVDRFKSILHIYLSSQNNSPDKNYKYKTSQNNNNNNNSKHTTTECKRPFNLHCSENKNKKKSSSEKSCIPWGGINDLSCVDKITLNYRGSNNRSSLCNNTTTTNVKGNSTTKIENGMEGQIITPNQREDTNVRFEIINPGNKGIGNLSKTKTKKDCISVKTIIPNSHLTFPESRLYRVKEGLCLSPNLNTETRRVQSTLDYTDHRRYQNEITVYPGLVPIRFAETSFQLLHNSHRRYKNRVQLKHKQYKTVRQSETVFISPKSTHSTYTTTFHHDFNTQNHWYQTSLEFQPKNYRSVYHIRFSNNNNSNNNNNYSSSMDYSCVNIKSPRQKNHRDLKPIYSNTYDDVNKTYQSKRIHPHRNIVKNDNMESGNIGKNDNIESGNIGKNDNIKSGNIGKNDNIESGNIGKNDNIESGNIGKNDNMESGNIGKNDNMESGNIGKNDNMESGNIGKNDNMESGNIGKNDNMESGNIGKNDNMETDKPYYYFPDTDLINNGHAINAGNLSNAESAKRSSYNNEDKGDYLALLTLHPQNDDEPIKTPRPSHMMSGQHVVCITNVLKQTSGDRPTFQQCGDQSRPRHRYYTLEQHFRK